MSKFDDEKKWRRWYEFWNDFVLPVVVIILIICIAYLLTYSQK